MWKSGLTIALASFFFAFSGCEDDDVGIPCAMSESSSVGPDDPVRINSQALDCRSRLCIKYNSAAKPLCTAPCDTADDCPDDSQTCDTGFACVVGQAVEGGGLGCCKLCVCKDFLDNPNEDRQAAACKDKTRTCPNI